MTGAGAALVLASVLLDLPSALLRLVLASLVLGAFTTLGGPTDIVAGLIAFGPLARTLLALAVPLPAPPAARAAKGARAPSTREQQALDRAPKLAGAARQPVLKVIDTPDEDAWVLGGTLFVSRGLFDSPHLVPVVAHELGHLDTGDGRVALAAWWLQVRSVAWLGLRCAGNVEDPKPHRDVLGALAHIPVLLTGLVLLLISGGLLPVVLRPLWAAYRRNREFAADAYATRRGLGGGLAEALASWQILDLAAPWWQGRSHPYVEQRLDRIDRLREGRG